MSACVNCGKEIDAAAYCPYCGHKTGDPAPADLERVQSDERATRVLRVVGIVIVLLVIVAVLSQRRNSPAVPLVYTPPASVAPAGDTITYTVGGNARSASLTYTNAGGNSEQKSDVPVPWSTTFTVEPGSFLYISAQNNGETGSINCEIRANGIVIEQASSEGAYTIATCSGRAR